MSTYVLDLGATRYFFPFFVFGAIAATRVLPTLISHRRNRIVIALGLCAVFVITTISNAAQARVNSKNEVYPFPEISQILESYHVTNGYASYWNAASTTLASKGRVTVEGVFIEGYPALLANKWEVNTSLYTKPAQFIIFENAAELTKAEPALTHLPAPDHIVTLETGYTLYVWKSDISSIIQGL